MLNVSPNYFVQEMSNEEGLCLGTKKTAASPYLSSRVSLLSTQEPVTGYFLSPDLVQLRRCAASLEQPVEFICLLYRFLVLFF